MATRGKGLSGMQWGLIGGAVAGGAALIPLVPWIRNRAMRATTILKKDHRKVSALLTTLEMTPAWNATIRKTLFEQIRQYVMVHAQAEEEVFYPVVQSLGFGEGESQVHEAYHEHQVVKDLLNDMHTMDTTTDVFDRKLDELKRNIQHHMEVEEDEMFELVTDRMPSEQLEDLGKRLSKRKKDLQTKIAA